MRIGVIVFHAGAIVAWLVLFFVTIHAVSAMGLMAAAPVFFDDFTHPWRQQFNIDLLTHFAIVSAWIIARSRTMIGAILPVVLACTMGALFTLPYILVAFVRADGDLKKLLLGANATR